jgi:phospho-N-acetylmuramoyl-pentapeptide-transferase
MNNYLTLFLGLVIFSFVITSLLMVPFINLLYKLRLQRRKEAPKKGKVPLFDKLHDIKAGTPVGGGVLIILVVFLLFTLIFPFSSRMGVYIRSAYNLRYEIFVIAFTFLSFGLLGLLDDLVKIFGKGRAGLGVVYGLTRVQKFALQWVLAFVISFLLYFKMGIKIIHIPLFDITFSLGFWYIPFAAFLIVLFSNAYNITDGLDGLAAGLLAISLAVFAVIASGNLDAPLSVFIALWLGSLIAFLYFNVWPARIFLGDSGALSFGATLAVIGLLAGSVFALLGVGAIYLIETATSAIQIFGWKFLKRPIFLIAPAHHIFLARGWEESKIVARAWLAGLILGIFALWLSTI